MKRTLLDNRIPIKLWLDDIDSLALAQAENLASLPFAVGHIAIMPDAHVGYGMPIGAVLATEDAVIPNAVGVDIGCGVCAVRSSLQEIDRGSLKKMMKGIRKAIPFGFSHHKLAQGAVLMPELDEENMPVVGRNYEKGRFQLGTLGGGNHFIEIQQGDDGYIWIMIHSGSRNLGYKVAEYHNRIACTLSKSLPVKVPAKWQLAFLPVPSREAKEYLAEMNYCLRFALANRKLMMQRVQDILMDVSGALEFDQLINKSHNFAAWEHHGGRKLLVHRKGATRVVKDELGLIPGSQGSASYIVRGLGNKDSFYSCSHGAGRRLSRKKAVRELDLVTEKRRLDKLDVIHGVRHKRDLDEAPGAYKDIEEVMKNQVDLVAIEVSLRPLAVMKG